MRESVIVTQILLCIVYPVVSIIAYASGYYKNYVTDEQFIELETVYKRDAMILGVGIIFAVITIVGALTYSTRLVLLGAVYVIIGNVLSTYYAYPVIKDAVLATGFYIAWRIILTLLTLYPHLVFMYEVKTGVLKRSIGEGGGVRALLPVSFRRTT